MARSILRRTGALLDGKGLLMSTKVRPGQSTLLLAGGLVLVVAVLWASLAAAGVAPSAAAAPNVVGIGIQPVVATTTVGGSVTVNVVITSAANLGAFEFTLAFAPATVAVTNVQTGPFLGSSGRTTYPLGPVIDNVAGTVTFGAYTLGAAPPGPNGNGIHKNRNASIVAKST